MTAAAKNPQKIYRDAGIMEDQNRNLFYDPSRSTLRRLLLGTIARDKNGLYYIVDDEQQQQGRRPGGTIDNPAIISTRRHIAALAEDTGEGGISSTTDIITTTASPMIKSESSSKSIRRGVSVTARISRSRNKLDGRVVVTAQPAILSSRQEVVEAPPRLRNNDSGLLRRADVRIDRRTRITKAMDALEIPKGCRSDMYFFRSLLNDMKSVPLANKNGLKAKIQKVIKDEIAKNDRKNSF